MEELLTQFKARPDHLLFAQHLRYIPGVAGGIAVRDFRRCMKFLAAG